MAGGASNSKKGGKKGPGADNIDSQDDLADANLNIIEFMAMKQKRPEELKFQRVVTAQGGNTFDDIRQNLEEFHR